MSLWPRLVETRGIVREICSYRLGPEGEYAALMDIDGRIVTLVSDSPASIEVGDTVIVAGFEKNRPFAYEKGASGIRMMKRPYSRLLVIGCLEAAVGLGTIGLAATFCMRAIQGGQAAIGLWKYLLIALAGAVSLLVGWYTLLVGGLAAFLSSVLTIRGDND
jgi:hypothetical protein